MAKRVLLFIALGLLAGNVYADKFGFVDLERAVNEEDEGNRVRAQLKKEFEEKQKILDEKQDELKKMQDAVTGKANMMKPEVKQQKEAEFQRKYAELQQMYMNFQQDMAKRQQEVMGELFHKNSLIIQTLGREGDYTMIFSKSELNPQSAVLYAKPSLDLTNEVIRRYNDAYGKGESKKETAKKKK